MDHHDHSDHHDRSDHQEHIVGSCYPGDNPAEDDFQSHDDHPCVCNTRLEQVQEASINYFISYLLIELAGQPYKNYAQAAPPLHALSPKIPLFVYTLKTDPGE